MERRHHNARLSVRLFSFPLAAMQNSCLRTVPLLTVRYIYIIGRRSGHLLEVARSSSKQHQFVRVGSYTPGDANFRMRVKRPNNGVTFHNAVSVPC